MTHDAAARITKQQSGVWIDSGPITATSKLDDVPEKNWYNLMCQRETFVKVHLPYDCRCLVQFVADAERMYGPLGYKDADDFIARGLKLVPDEIRHAVNYLKTSKPTEAIPLDVAVRLGKHGGDRDTPRDEVGRFVKLDDAVRMLGKHGGPQVGVTNLPSPSAKGTTRSYILARLDRDGFAELAAQVRAKQISANAAAIKAGFRQKPTPFEQVLRLLPKLTEAERQQLIRHLRGGGQ
jgi:hypothetical protein